MDPNAVAAASTAAAQPALLIWIQTYGQYVAFFAQIIFWAGILLFTGYAVWTYKRYVNFLMGVGHSGQLRLDAEEEDAAQDIIDVPAPKKSKKSEKVSVEEFVE